MGKLALTLAFFAAGLNFVALKLGDAFGGKAPLLYAVAMGVPAVTLGAASWWSVASFARSRLIVACALIAVAGMFYATEPENHRGFVGLSYILMTLPIAALIVENRCWWLCAKVYVYANALALSLALYFEYWVHGITMLGDLHRLGFLRSSDGAYRLANPNVVGGQLAFASVLAFIMYLKAGSSQSEARKAAVGLQKFSLAWTLFLSLGCILTASRGAFVAWLGGMGPLLFWGTRSQKSYKVRDLVGFGTVLALLMLFASIAVGFTPWGSLQGRFDSQKEIVTGSGRTLIWKYAFDTWRTNPQYWLVGTGTGTAPEALGRHLGLTQGDGYTPAALDAHNAFVEWGLSFGLFGAATGICMLVTVCRRARHMDRRDGTINRQVILLCFCLTSMNYVTFYQQFFVAAGALILSSLSAPSPIGQARLSRPEPADSLSATGQHRRRPRLIRHAPLSDPVSQES
ncbi:MAG: O-antigen ligase family protein [Pirellulales bacterium]|nr:O-antigen ligase family protein [Pirellulales bacterium]